MKRQIVSAASLLLAVGMICACSGGGGSSSSSATGTTSLPKSTVSGMVADGYLAGATVFMDKNSNYILDEGEPSASTDNTGAFTLTIDTADIGKYPIVALAIKGTTIDLDDNQPVANTYVLSMHGVSVKSSKSGTLSGMVSNFISPISTQIREMIESGKYANVQTAATALRAEMGLPTFSNMTGDYIKNGDNGMHNAARNMASVMGGQMGFIMSNGKVDVSGYRGMMGSIFQNISSINRGHNPTDSIFHDISSAHVKPVHHQFSSMFRSKKGGMASK